MQAVINASQEGTKLRPLTCGKPPALLTVLGREALLRQIGLLKEAGVDSVLVITGYMSRCVKETAEEQAGIKLVFAPSGAGEAASLKENANLLEDEFIYFSSCAVTDAKLTDALDFHREKDAFATIIAPKGSLEGKIVADKSGRVTRFEEKKLWSLFSASRTGSGIYILKRDIVRFIADDTAADLSETVLPALVRAGKSIYTYLSNDTFEEIADFPSYLRANFAAVEKLCAKEGGAFSEEGATVEAGALLESPCYIASGARIKKGAKIGAYSVIGAGSVVCEGASVKKSVVGKGCRIGAGAALRGCVLDDGVSIGKNASVYEQAVIGEGCKIGAECAVRSFVRIWPEKVIDDCVTVSENVMWGQKNRSHLFMEKAIAGVVNSDITPSFCLRLGECVGTAADMGEIGISSDGTPSSAMLRDALAAGLLSTGASVRDFGEQPLPITRRGVAFYMMKGGVSINVSEDEGEEYAEITVIDEKGLDAGEALRERLEGHFEKGDFMRCDPKGVKEREYLFEYKLYYLKNLINSTKREKASLDLLISCGAPWGRRLLTSAASDFDSKVSVYSPVVSFGGKGESEFAAAVRKGGFDAGFITDSRCEKLTVVNCDGRIVSGEEYEALCALIIMKKYPSPTVYVPVTASEAIETLGEKYGAKVVRTKSAQYEIMEKLSGGEDYLSDQFTLRFDAVGAVIKILDFISSFDTNLTELLSLLPSISMTGTEIALPPEEIENALKRIKKLAGAEKESVEGVKITFDKGWVVVIPDAYKNVCRVVSEGRTEEFARELCDFCVEEILRM